MDPRGRAAAEARLTIRLTAEQLELLKARAEATQLTVTEYARLVLVAEEGALLLRLTDRTRRRFERAAEKAGRSLSWHLESLLLGKLGAE